MDVVVLVPNSQLEGDLLLVGDLLLFSQDGEAILIRCNPNLENIIIPKEITRINEYAFYNCSSLKRVYYGGSCDDWSNISIGSANYNLTNATIYYCCEEKPTDDGNYWHYFDGVVTEWKKDEE